MKLYLIAVAFLSGALLVRGQSTFVWDQQNTNSVDASDVLSDQPLGQSFTPSQSSMDVAAFLLSGGFGASGDIQVNLRSGSITGTILGTSGSVTYGEAGIYDFLFSNPITLAPGTQYYLQPVLTSGGGVVANMTFIQYTGGDAIFDGVAHTDRDFWFQEGTVSSVPEPSLTALLAVGGGIALWHRRKRRIG